MNRRTFVCTSCATAGALLAGCLDSTDDSGDRSSGGDGTDDGAGTGAGSSGDGGSSGSGGDGADSGGGSTGTAATASYEPVSKWAVPADSPDDPTYGYRIRANRPRRLLRAEGGGSTNLTWQVQTSTAFYWGYVEPSKLDLFVTVRPAGVFRTGYEVVSGDFDAAAVTEDVVASAKRTETYEGFDLYGGVVNESLKEELHDPRAFAIGDGTVIQAGGRHAAGSNGTIEHLQRVIDAGTGSTGSVVDQHDALATAAAQIEPAAFSALTRTDPSSATDVERSRLAGVATRGLAASFDGPTADRTEVFVYESADAVVRSDVEALVEHERSKSGVRSVSFDVDGNVATIESTVDAVVLFP